MTSRRPGELFRGFQGHLQTPVSVIDQNEDYKGFIVRGEESSKKELIEGVSRENNSDESSLKDDKNGNMMTEEDYVQIDHETGLDTSEIIEKAKENLEKLDLNEAERLFLKSFRCLQEKPEETDRPLIEVYIGLADVCTRKSRTNRQNPLEWQWLCVHATTLLEEAVELYETEMYHEQDNQTRDQLASKKDWAFNRSQALEDVLGRTIYNWLRDNWRVVDPYHSQNIMGALTPTTASRFPLSSLLGHGIRPYQSGFITQSVSLESLHEAPMTEIMTGGNTNWFKRLQLYCHKRLQSKNVKEILDEVLHHKISDSNSASSDLRQETDTNTEESSESLDMADEDEMSRLDSSQQANSLVKELTANNVDLNGWNFFLEDRKNCEIDSVIELASEEQESELSIPAPKIADKILVSPLQERPIRLTIAKVFHKVVSKLLNEEEFDKAELLCEEILQIVDDIQDGTVRLLRFSGELMQNIGLLCIRQGNVHKGKYHLEKALKLFRDLEYRDAHREVALVLIDLGNMHVVQVLSEDALYDEIIAAISDFFEKEASDEAESGESSPESRRSQEVQPPQESINSINEAITCYTEALMVLENNEETQLEFVGKALLKLGDCHFMLQSYGESLNCYERAMKYFRHSSVFGKESLLSNAHVLMMLGVSTFMLHVYPRAASVFELSHRMVRQLQHSHGMSSQSFLQGLLHSLLGISYYKMKSYHKCVSMCFQAFENFWNMYGEKIPDLPKLKFWLVCQNLYILGNSYNVLNLQHKAIKYLNVGRELMKTSKIGEKRQFMRILQILGDCYFAQYDYKTALTYYNEALDFNDHPDLETYEIENQVDLNQSSEDMALHNQLLSRSADAHISMKQYQNAVHYLEQARDIQDVLEDDIKGDLVSTLYQLGQMHSFAGDVDKAIDSYKESLEVFRELHDGGLGPEMCTSLGNLATMCYVKACICESIDQELEMILAAEQYFQDALGIKMNQSVCVKYANFLYSQGNYDDAILYLEDALKEQCESEEIVFGGLEKVTLPEPLQDEVDAQEEVCMPATSLARYILVLSNVMMRRMKDAEKCLINLMKEVYDSDIPFLWSVLAYAMLEMGLYKEAALSFKSAVSMDPEYHLAMDNYCMCLCIMALSALQKGFESFFIYYKLWYEDPGIPDLGEGKGY